MEQNKNPWSELDVPHGGEVTISEVNDFYWNKASSTLSRSGHEWTNHDVRQIMSKESGAERFILRGPVQVVKGQEPVVGGTLELIHALEVLYDFPVATDLHKQPWFLEIGRTDSDELVQVRLKSVVGIHARTPDHIIISKRLSEQLKLGGVLGLGAKDIKILGFHAEIEDLDLDKWG